MLSHLTKTLSRSPLGQSRFLLRMQHHMMRFLIRDNVIELGDMLINVHSPTDFIAKKLYTFGVWEPHIIRAMKKVIRTGDTVMDVGANIGFLSIHMSRLVGPSGRVLAFEPEPRNLELLKKNIEQNGCNNVSIFPVALADKNGSQELYTCDENTMCHSLAKVDGVVGSLEVQVGKASEFTRDCQVAFAKIDVEGAEPLVIKGMDKLPKRLIFEFYPKVLHRSGHDPSVFLQDVVGKGFQLSIIMKDDTVRTNPAALQKMTLEDPEAVFNLLAEPG